MLINLHIISSDYRKKNYWKMLDFQGQAGDKVHKNKTKIQLNFIQIFSHIRISIIYAGKVATLIVGKVETIVVSYDPIVKGLRG